MTDTLESLRSENAWLHSTIRSLHDQIECGGCAAAHDGERTYECRIDTKCGLCKLRNRAETAELLLETTAPTEDEFQELARLIWSYRASYDREFIWLSRAREVWGY